MHKFKDSTGQTWEIELAVYQVNQLREATGVDLLKPEASDGDTNTHERLHSDYAHLFEVLFTVCESQIRDVHKDRIRAAADGHTGDDRKAAETEAAAAIFGRAMAADCLVDARAAFFNEWAAMLRGLQKLEQVVLIEKTIMLSDAALEATRERLNDPKMAEMESHAVAKIRQEVDSAFDDLAGKLGDIFNDNPQEVTSNE